MGGRSGWAVLAGVGAGGLVSTAGGAWVTVTSAAVGTPGLTGAGLMEMLVAAVVGGVLARGT